MQVSYAGLHNPLLQTFRLAADLCRPNDENEVINPLDFPAG
jgi:hypothetical protein